MLEPELENFIMAFSKQRVCNNSIRRLNNVKHREICYNAFDFSPRELSSTGFFSLNITIKNLGQD